MYFSLFFREPTLSFIDNNHVFVLIWALVFLFDSTLWVYSVTHCLSPNIDSQYINFVGCLLANGSV